MLVVNSISKKFGDHFAVKKVSFEVKQGEVLGFLGPNGAGKSTTMRMITGFLEATEGDVLICNNSINNKRLIAQKNIGYVPENAPLYEDMYVREFLEFIAKMRNILPDQIEAQINYILKTCAIESVHLQKIETLSKGYKRRVSLAQALIHNPNVLVLDEPTDGLDPNQKYDVRNLIKELAKEKCILISTHILEEVEEVCDKCIIIGEGKILFRGTPEEIKAKSNRNNMQDVFRAITTGDNIDGVNL